MTGLVIGTLDQWHNKLMIYSAGDLGVEIDFGSNQPGSILQHKGKGCWHDYLVDANPSDALAQMRSLISYHRWMLLAMIGGPTHSRHW